MSRLRMTVKQHADSPVLSVRMWSVKTAKGFKPEKAIFTEQELKDFVAANPDIEVTYNY